MNASERRAGYLDDLGRLLQEMTPVERIAVIDRVRERIDKAAARLGHEPSGEEMGGILAGVGAVEDVAEEALAARSPSAAGQTPGPEAPTAAEVPEPVRPADETTSASEPTERAGTAAVGQAEVGRAEAPVTTPAPAASASSRARYDLSNIPAMEWPEDAAPRPGLTKRWVMLIALPLIGLGAFFLLFLLPALALIIGVALLWIAPLWTRQERVIGTLVPALGLGAFLPLLAIGSGPDGSSMLLLLALVLAVCGIAALVWLAVRGSRAVRAVDEQMAAAATTTRRR